MNLYKALWSRIGGRMWTYIWRDIYHQAPIVIQVLWFFIGVSIYLWQGWRGVLIFWCIYMFGFLEGHFHWGKKWIKGQGLTTNDSPMPIWDRFSSYAARRTNT